MKKNILNGAIAGALLCIAILPFAGCDTGNSAAALSPDTDSPSDPASSTSAANVDFFKDASISTPIADSFAAEVGDMNATWGDDATNGKATSDMGFSADSSIFESGTASLKVIATVLQNTYSHNVGQWSVKTNLSKAGVTAPVNLTGKTVSIKAYIPAAGALSAVKLVFIDIDGKKSQGKEVPIATKDTWSDVTYKYVDGGSSTSDYTVPGFDITKVSAISIVAIKNAATASSSETLYIDSLSW